LVLVALWKALLTWHVFVSEVYFYFGGNVVPAVELIIANIFITEQQSNVSKVQKEQL